MEVFIKNNVLKNLQSTKKQTPVLESHINKIEQTLWILRDRCLPLYLAKFLRTTISRVPMSGCFCRSKIFM